MVYALWDTQSINLVGAFDNLREALALVMSGIERNGPQDTETLALDVEDDDGTVRPIAHGEELAELARREFMAKPLARNG